jgi:hypothetical protein
MTASGDLVGPTRPTTRRFPGFDVLDQRKHWDAETAAVVVARLEAPAPLRFFDTRESRTVAALVQQLLALDTKTSFGLCASIDSRLADESIDGWHYDAMPEDVVAWRRSVVALDDESRMRFQTTFVELDYVVRTRVVAGVQNAGFGHWHGMPASRLWDLWLRYACTAYYAHPAAWNEIGFAGPAYPRGYKNAGIDKREPFEVKDADPGEDPTRVTRT